MKCRSLNVGCKWRIGLSLIRSVNNFHRDPWTPNLNNVSTSLA
jgi:hypothetical protein